MLAGYKIDLSEDFVDTFLLRHPSKFDLNRLIISPTGFLVALDGKFQIALDDNEQFRTFILRQVPLPTWWDRFRSSIRSSQRICEKGMPFKLTRKNRSDCVEYAIIHNRLLNNWHDRRYLDDNDLDAHRPCSEPGKKLIELLRSKGKAIMQQSGYEFPGWIGLFGISNFRHGLDSGDGDFISCHPVKRLA
jgi:hypothetical protein